MGIDFRLLLYRGTATFNFRTSAELKRRRNKKLNACLEIQNFNFLAQQRRGLADIMVVRHLEKPSLAR